MPLNCFHRAIAGRNVARSRQPAWAYRDCAGWATRCEIRGGAQAEAGADCAAAVPSHPEQFAGCELVVRRPGRL